MLSFLNILFCLLNIINASNYFIDDDFKNTGAHINPFPFDGCASDALIAHHGFLSDFSGTSKYMKYTCENGIIKKQKYNDPNCLFKATKPTYFNVSTNASKLYSYQCNSLDNYMEMQVYAMPLGNPGKPKVCQYHHDDQLVGVMQLSTDVCVDERNGNSYKVLCDPSGAYFLNYDNNHCSDTPIINITKGLVETNKITKNCSFWAIKKPKLPYTVPYIGGSIIVMHVYGTLTKCVNNSKIISPTNMPTQITLIPTTSNPTLPTISPTKKPTNIPTIIPTIFPTLIPTIIPTNNPSKYPTIQPTDYPSLIPTKIPTTAKPTYPTWHPTLRPTWEPTMKPTYRPTYNPSKKPTKKPTYNPTYIPTKIPTNIPTKKPSLYPTKIPTKLPTFTKQPTINPTKYPSFTLIPTISPTQNPNYAEIMGVKDNLFYIFIGGCFLLVIVSGGVISVICLRNSQYFDVQKNGRIQQKRIRYEIVSSSGDDDTKIEEIQMSKIDKKIDENVIVTNEDKIYDGNELAIEETPNQNGVKIQNFDKIEEPKLP